MEDFLEKIKKEISSTIAVDFDGVMHKNSKGFHDGTIYDDPLPGTKEALAYLYKKYSRLVIYTCKANPERPLVNGKTAVEMIWEWLEKHEMKEYICEIMYGKPRATFYIDDKAISFKTWEQTLDEIDKLNDVVNDISRF